ncbi:MAG: ATP-binding protein [Vicinamibacteria bacterium]
MTPPAGPPELWTARLDERLAERTRRPGPAFLTGPPGAGKTTLLLRVKAHLERAGWTCVYLDLMAAASSPDRFVTAALDVMPVEAFGARLPEAVRIRRLASSGREHEAAAVDALFALWASLPATGARPVALLFDEATEIRSLAYFKGLREVHRPFLDALARRGAGTLCATSYPSHARRLWPELDAMEAAPLGAADVAAALDRAGLRADADLLVRATAGWARYVRVLIDALGDRRDPVAAWAEEMAPGGRLDLACRHTYEALLLRSRGYGMSKAVLATVADEEGLNLTALVGRLGRTPGAVRDYLVWLVGVDALRMVKKKYFFVDGILRAWVRLHGRGRPPSAAELRQAALAITAAPATDAEPEPAPVEDAPAASRHDRLMEID